MPDHYAYANDVQPGSPALQILPGNGPTQLMPEDIFTVYGKILEKHCGCSIDDDVWRIPYRDGLQTVSVRFSALHVSVDELRLIKAYIVDTLSKHSSPSACANRVRNIAVLFDFLHERGFAVTMLSPPVLHMYHLWLDDHPGWTAARKNKLEAVLKSFLPFLQQLHLLRPGNMIAPKPRPTPPAKLVRAPEEAVLRKLDRFFFDFNIDIPCDFRCAYIIARLIPMRDAEVFSLPLECFSLHEELITICTPTFKETPNHKPIYHEYHRLSQPFPECALVQALQEQQDFARKHQTSILSPARKGRLMVSSRDPRRLTRADEFNRYLKDVCSRENILNHTGTPAKITMYSLRHAIGAAMSADAGVSGDEFTRAFRHTNAASDNGYGYPSQYDELNRTAAATQQVRDHLTSDEATTRAGPRVILQGRLVKMQQNTGALLIGAKSVCEQRGCSPQFAKCVQCNDYIPNPQHIPEAMKCCEILRKRIEQCKNTGDSALLEFNRQQLSVYQLFIAKANTIYHQEE